MLEQRFMRPTTHLIAAGDDQATSPRGGEANAPFNSSC
jgi:hypothetical protein